MVKGYNHSSVLRYKNNRSTEDITNIKTAVSHPSYPSLR